MLSRANTSTAFCCESCTASSGTFCDSKYENRSPPKGRTPVLERIANPFGYVPTSKIWRLSYHSMPGLIASCPPRKFRLYIFVSKQSCNSACCQALLTDTTKHADRQNVHAGDTSNDSLDFHRSLEDLAECSTTDEEETFQAERQFNAQFLNTADSTAPFLEASSSV